MIAPTVRGFAEREVTSRARIPTSRGSSKRLAEHDESHDCPVCGARGWLLCDVSRGDPEFVHDGEETWAVVSLTAHLWAFDCGVCRFELEGDELLEYDFPREIELEPDTDPQEAYDFEPDEDWLRDR